LKICLIGGIYGKAGKSSGYLRITPETTLENGLRAAGHEVTTLSHYAATDFGRFDVVHVHHLSYGAARLASDPSLVPFLFTPHDASEMSGVSISTVRKLASRFVVSRADCVVTLSRTEANFQRAAHGIEESRLATIPNGIDPAAFPFRRENSAGRGRRWQLLFVGQLIPLKGCDLILRAIARLSQDVELNLVYQTGDLKQSLEALAGELGIREKVHFLGRQEPSRLAQLYQQSDLLILASETEALPSVITEAMFSGLPFISTAVGGIREQAGGFGWLLQRRSVACLAEGIDHVLTHYEHFAGSAGSMSLHARNTYSIEAMIAGHLAAYQDLAGTYPRRLEWRRTALNGLTRLMVSRLGTRPKTIDKQDDNHTYRAASPADSL
jgi:glycosyltransferase involved in cell wall biosynthesis